MIKKLEIQEIEQPTGSEYTIIERVPATSEQMHDKINELIDTINAIQKEREAERFEIQEWIGLFEAVRKSVNVHEKQIDELQMKLEPHKCETRSENVQPDTESRSENVQDETPRCPFCGEELSYAQEIDGGFEILTCDCPRGIWLFGNDKMWYTLGKVNKMAQNPNFAQPEVKKNVQDDHYWFKQQERYKAALVLIRNLSGAGMSYQDMCIESREIAKWALDPDYKPLLIGRYSKDDQELFDTLRETKGGNNE